MEASNDRPTIEVSTESHAVAASFNINPAIHEEDFIFWFVYRRWAGDMNRAVSNYYELGKYSCNLVVEVIEEIKRVKEACGLKWSPETLVDFASGYGCALRHLKNGLPNTHVSSCDIHSSAVTFNSSALGFDSFLSSTTPERLDLPLQDVIIALSFFSHMPQATFGRWIWALTKHLKPGGALIFTANGYVTDITGSAGSTKVGSNGFGFTPASEQSDLDGNDYGLTISYPQWVFYTISQCPDIRLARFQEGFWWARQDLYVCMKSEASQPKE